jgi:hypothetical protein
MLSCDTPQYNSVAAGAACRVTGADRLLPLPNFVHWFVAGALTDIYCGTSTDPYQWAKCGVGGLLGGFAASRVV